MFPLTSINVLAGGHIMFYNHDQAVALVQYTIGATVGEGCSVEDAEAVIRDWQRIS